MKAMILAAGRGTRLQPLTDYEPKAAVPVLDVPLIRHNLEMLKGAGVSQVTVNLHYLPEQVRAALEWGDGPGIEIHYSVEKDYLLGTGGGLKKAQAFLQDGTFILVNADILARLDLAGALAWHRSKRALATLILTRRAALDDFGPVGANDEGRVSRLVNIRPSAAAPTFLGVFTGVHILEPEIFSLMPDKNVFCLVRDFYVHLVAAGYPVYAYFSEGFWNDLGTPKRYLESQKQMLERPDLLDDFLKPFGLLSAPVKGVYYLGEGEAKATDVSIKPPCLIGSGVKFGSGARIGPGVIIGRGSTIGEAASLESSVVWPLSRVAPGAKVENAVVYSGGQLQV